MDTHENIRDKKSTYNNFDLIRLLAATQVAFSHAAGHLNVNLEPAFILGAFPGVPIFFFVSGNLIYQSYANIKQNRLRVFFRNRFLRLYPALFVCFFLTLGSLVASGYLKSHSPTIGGMLLWTATSLTFFQFYNPDFLREYGVGAINGSLWTISVELQFYLLTPLLYAIAARRRHLLFPLFFLLVVLNAFNTFLNDHATLPQKLFGVSFLPWLYMFVFGAFISRSKELEAIIRRGSVSGYLIAYLCSYFAASILGLPGGNEINVLSFILLACLITKVAHTKPSLSKRLVKGNDISYGVYIYHMPIVNFLLFKGISGTTGSLVLALFLVFCVAAASWFLVEKPSLKLKSVALRSYK